MTVLGVVIGGGLGALARYQVGGLVASRQRTSFPYGTLVVNVVGSLALGLLVGLVASGRLATDWLTWAGVGFCGGLTTFSTFSYETLQLSEQGAYGLAARNILFSFGASIGAAALGYLAGGAG